MTDSEEEYPVFARITLVEVEKGKMDEAIKVYEESVVPAAKSQNGYLSAHLLVDREAGKGVSITAWETEKDADAGEQSGYYQEQIAKFKGIFSAPPVRKKYEIAVSDMKSSM